MKKTSKKEMKKLGQFTVESGKVLVTDPCYEKGTWCSACVDNVKKGLWNAFVRYSDEGSWGIRAAELIVKSVGAGKLVYRKLDADIGVDSGQAGVFDSKYYKDDTSVEGCKREDKEHGPLCEEEPFYSICCDRTLGPNQGGVIPFGAVSSSGIGDGGYDAFIAENDQDEVIAIKIKFL